MKHWRTKSRRTLVKDRWISLHADECELPNGQVISPFYVMEEKEWVHIVALNPSGEILLNISIATQPTLFVVSCRAVPLKKEKSPLRRQDGS